MRVEILSDGEISIFVSGNYKGICDCYEKEKLVEVVKDIVKKLKRKLKLKGFYKLKVFFNKFVGIFIRAIKIDEVEYSNVLDLRVIVYTEQDIYFETDDYFKIRGVKNIRFYRDKFYCLVDDILDIYNVVDWGRFIYGEEVLDMLDNSCLV